MRSGKRDWNRAFQPCTTPPPPLHSGVAGLLDVLKDDDCLRSVLLWTAASDHLALWKSCRRFREMIDSDLFVRERCEQGFAEISVSLADTFESYKQDYEADSDDEQERGPSRSDPSFLRSYNDLGYVGEMNDTQVAATILVDGREAGQVEFCLLPMFGHQNFHELGDSISGDLQRISTRFFSRGGKPTRVKSVKAAYDEFCSAAVPTDVSNYFLYLQKWELKPPYRTTSDVCACALRGLLQQPRVKGRWRLAMYIPWGKLHMTQEELDSEYGGDLDPHACFFKKPTKEYKTMLEERTIRDMRYFLRAGFQQVPELVPQTENSYYVFCVPTFLNSEMISNEQALTSQVKTFPTEPERSKEAEELLDYAVKQCGLRSRHQWAIKNGRCQGPVQDRVTGKIEKLKQFLNKIFPTMVEAPVSPARKELEGMDDRFRSKIQEAVEVHGKSIVQDSNILHACAANATISFLEIALECLPPEDRAQAINSRDKNQATPLMCAACSNCKFEEVVETCQLLIKHGANKDLADGAGLTAFGKFRSKMRSSNDFCRSMFGSAEKLRQIEEHLREMEPVLMPSDGPTEADDAQLEEELPDDDDGGGWDDEGDY